jgi:Holliday junction resolvase RusA-like endonuclease
MLRAMFEPITFVVEGRAVTQGSKNPNVPRYRDGTLVLRHKRECPGSYSKESARRLAMAGCGCPPMVNMIEDNDGELEPWREAIRWAAKMAYKGEPLDVLCVMSLVFVKPRPKAHYGTGRNAEVLKDRAPAAPGVKPDTGKMARAVEDALTGMLYRDDSLLVDTHHFKRYCHRWEPERVIVTLRPATFQTVGDMVAAGQLELPRQEQEYEQMALAI